VEIEPTTNVQRGLVSRSGLSLHALQSFFSTLSSLNNSEGPPVELFEVSRAIYASTLTNFPQESTTQSTSTVQTSNLSHETPNLVSTWLLRWLGPGLCLLPAGDPSATIFSMHAKQLANAFVAVALGVKALDLQPDNHGTSSRALR